ncbi:ZYRO0D12914p [Zygosaccharomyces rouxii]|uniref:ZYRO0D12914p n=1 Tax=Zygosaccharomyces rouxii (strain ATCC 2623 / CBS 732 / NBRC 1130 / NCYC 568 / NRRL Y-229) TaxID=559307 RepID=C5DW92_ZYGRC|nr:uncharacterized protein ZYRO0D12914g [Zygosaccharomyces rouxii]KAH9200969.1 hypothetical protein LQ764DRAFT_102273 [Zygosaccharomyces rouxii]CAR28061.1 ZYRO0D12914p [Zygosaccharomyces rouxii]
MPMVSHNQQQFHLSHEEEEKLNHFQAITTFPDDDLPSVIKLLERDGWGLELALSHYFDGNWKELIRPVEAPPIPDRPPTPTPVGSPALPQNSMFRGPFIASDSNLVPALRSVRPLPMDYKERYRSIGLNKKNVGIWQLDQQESPFIIVLMFLPKLLWRLGFSIGSLIWGIITFGFRSHVEESPKVFNLPASPKEQPLPLSETLPQVISDENAVNRLSKLVCKDMTFNDALKQCEDEFKYLLLIFVGDTNPAEGDVTDVNSQRLLNRILTNETVLHFLEEHQDEIIIYARHVAELEPWLVAKELKVKYTPECLLVGNVLNSSGTLNGVTKLSVLSKLRVSSPKKFYHSLKMVYERFNAELIVSRTEKDELRLAREIKQLQDSAYEESLKKDQLKKEQRELAQEEEKARRDRELEVANNKKLQSTLNQLSWLKACHDRLTTEEESVAKGEKRATLQFRTSNGARLVLKFPGETTLHDLYIKIGCHLYLNYYRNDLQGWSEQILTKLQRLSEDEEFLCFKGDQTGYHPDQVPQLVEQELFNLGDGSLQLKSPKMDFELISPFPRKKIEQNAQILLKDIPELWPNGSLLVEDIVDDDADTDVEEEED